MLYTHIIFTERDSSLTLCNRSVSSIKKDLVNCPFVDIYNVLPYKQDSYCPACLSYYQYHFIFSTNDNL